MRKKIFRETDWRPADHWKNRMRAIVGDLHEDLLQIQAKIWIMDCGDVMLDVELYRSFGSLLPTHYQSLTIQVDDVAEAKRRAETIAAKMILASSFFLAMGEEDTNYGRAERAAMEEKP